MSTCKRISAIINPVGRMNVLSATEVRELQDTSKTGLYSLFRACCLAVLNCEEETDDADQLMTDFADFDIRIIQEQRGLKLELINAPASAFVGDRLIRGVRENLFSVVRDILYVHSQLSKLSRFDAEETSDGITNVVFHILRNAKVFVPKQPPNIAVCWGGHSINREEYKYTKKVGYQLGLYGMDVCTGCGPGAMKGPMKGAYIGHAKQRISNGRFIGLTEPGIIAAESPNPIVNELIILPDIEKRLESFGRIGHGFIVFPGGPGTAEEILYLLGVLLHPDNREMPFPLIFTGPASSAEYFAQIDRFIGRTLGADAQSYYQIIIDDPQQVAKTLNHAFSKVTRYRRKMNDAYYFNWKLNVDHSFQQPFEPTHDNMAQLQLDPRLPPHELAANLRRAMSGIVAGNVKQQGINAIRQHGPFCLNGEASLMQDMDELLSGFVNQGRMKLPGKAYTPCYRIDTL